MMLLDRIDHRRRRILVAEIVGRSGRDAERRVEQSFLHRPAEIVSRDRRAHRACLDEVDLVAAQVADVSHVKVARRPIKVAAKRIFEAARHHFRERTVRPACERIRGRHGEVFVGVARKGVCCRWVDVESQNLAVGIRGALRVGLVAVANRQGRARRVRAADVRSTIARCHVQIVPRISCRRRIEPDPIDRMKIRRIQGGVSVDHARAVARCRRRGRPVGIHVILFEVVEERAALRFVVGDVEQPVRLEIGVEGQAYHSAVPCRHRAADVDHRRFGVRRLIVLDDPAETSHGGAFLQLRDVQVVIIPGSKCRDRRLI